MLVIDSASNKSVSRVFQIGPGIALIALLCGCSSFNKEWRTAGEGVPATDLAGRWDGSWKSDVNGHHGRLRCIMSKKDDQVYTARFHANYLKILSFTYTADLKTTRETNEWTFTGSADLVGVNVDAVDVVAELPKLRDIHAQPATDVDHRARPEQLQNDRENPFCRALSRVLDSREEVGPVGLG